MFAAAGSKKRRSRQQPEDAADAAQQPLQAHKHGSKHGSKHKHSDKQHHKKHKQGGKDDRPHFGDMTGPAEADVWQSDDSDKVGAGSTNEGWKSQSCKASIAAELIGAHSCCCSHEPRSIFCCAVLNMCCAMSGCDVCCCAAPCHSVT